MVINEGTAICINVYFSNEPHGKIFACNTGT